jgi:hypothetical protein
MFDTDPLSKAPLMPMCLTLLSPTCYLYQYILSNLYMLSRPVYLINLCIEPILTQYCLFHSQPHAPVDLHNFNTLPMLCPQVWFAKVPPLVHLHHFLCICIPSLWTLDLMLHS